VPTLLRDECVLRVIVGHEIPRAFVEWAEAANASTAGPRVQLGTARRFGTTVV